MPALTPAPAATLARRAPTARPGRVPVEFVGLARDLLRRLDVAYPAAEARRSALLAPFRPHPAIKIFTPTPRRAVLARLANRLQTASTLCRLRAAVQHEAGRLRVTEAWAIPSWLEEDSWDEREPAVALTVRKVEIGQPSFIEVNYRIAGVGLHALARRYQRGADRSDAAVLSDLAALSEGYLAAVAAGGEFEIPAGSGRWIGAASAAVAIVRTFLDR